MAPHALRALQQQSCCTEHRPVQAVVRHIGRSALEELCEDPALAHIKVVGDVLLITLHMEDRAM